MEYHAARDRLLEREIRGRRAIEAFPLHFRERLQSFILLLNRDSEQYRSYPMLVHGL